MRALSWKGSMPHKFNGLGVGLVLIGCVGTAAANATDSYPGVWHSNNYLLGLDDDAAMGVWIANGDLPSLVLPSAPPAVIRAADGHPGPASSRTLFNDLPPAALLEERPRIEREVRHRSRRELSNCFRSRHSYSARAA